jgi:hypothetical protein
VTFDGGKIHRFFSHVSGGFQQVDHCFKDPKTCTSLFSGCFAKDTKQLYCDELHEFFTFFKEYELEKGGRIKFVFPQDDCCTVTSDTLVATQPKETSFHVDKCKQAKCYHHPMLNENTINGWEHCKAELEADFS